jgi:2-dehydropantoate 2-reductase
MRPLKMAVVGCGALGSYYGACLARSGQDMHFLLRSDYETVRRHGVRVLTGTESFTVHPKAALDPAEIGVCDVVWIGLKTTANREFARLLPPLVGPTTAVVTWQNGLGNEEALASLFGPERIYGGLCFVCLNRLEPGVIHHLAHGRIVLGAFQGADPGRLEALGGYLRAAGIPCDLSPNLKRAHWEKLVWNIPFNGLGVAAVAGREALRSGAVMEGQAWESCRTTDQLLGDPFWREWVVALMDETLAAARAQGLALADSVARDQLVRTEEMGAYKASTLIDFERGQPLELESLFEEPCRRALAAGLAVPRLQSLVKVLRDLDGRRSAS